MEVNSQRMREQKRWRAAGLLAPMYLFAIVGVAGSALLWIFTPATIAGKLRGMGYELKQESVVAAATEGQVEALRLLAEGGMNLVADGEPFLAAVKAKNLPAMEFLHSQHGAWLKTAFDFREELPVEVAWEGKFRAGFQFLIANGYRGPTDLLVKAVQRRDDESLEFLLEKGNREQMNQALGEAVSRNAHAAAVAILRRGADPNYFWAGRPILHLAMDQRDLETARELLASGADPDKPCQDGRLLVHHLLDQILNDENGNTGISCLQLLSAHKANFDLVDHRGESALHRVARLGNRNLLALFLDGKANPQHPFQGNTVIGSALLANQREVIKDLAERAQDLDCPAIQGKIPLEAALEQGDYNLAEFLLKNGATPHPALFFHAVEAGNVQLVDLLLSFGANPDAHAPDGDTPLCSSIKRGDLAMVECLLSAGSDLLTPGGDGQEPLVIAVATKQVGILEHLISHGADLNRDLREPYTPEFRELCGSKRLSWYMSRDSRFKPLMVAAGHGDPDTLRILLKNGAEKFPTTRRWKRYPISFASEEMHVVAQQILSGADPAHAEVDRHVIIDLSSQSATLYLDGKVSLTSNVSTGKPGYRTPTGTYVITHKHRNWNSTLYGSSMPYFMRLSCGSFGMHVGVCPGYPASHGCIRMPHAKAKAMWSMAPVGTKVTIQQ